MTIRLRGVVLDGEVYGRRAVGRLGPGVGAGPHQHGDCTRRLGVHRDHQRRDVVLSPCVHRRAVGEELRDGPCIVGANGDLEPLLDAR